jgi:alpha-N-acetylglucosaminidase
MLHLLGGVVGFLKLGLSLIALMALVPRLLPSLMGSLYDVVIVKMTAKWYKAVLEELKPDSRVLDVGIGTGAALARNAATVRLKRLDIVGVDYEREYINHAQGVIQAAGLESLVSLVCASIYDKALATRFARPLNFDAVYFSGSLTLMPDPAGALTAAAAMLKPGGKVYITQTYQNAHSPVTAVLKPWLRTLTTIDFGRLTYYSEVAAIIDAARMKVLEDRPVPGSLDSSRYQTARLLVLQANQDRVKS